MKTADFQTQALPLLHSVHEALRLDDGSIERLTAVGDALIVALNFMAESYDQITDPEARTQIETTSESMLAALGVNNMRIAIALQSAAELAQVMSGATEITLH